MRRALLLLAALLAAGCVLPEQAPPAPREDAPVQAETAAAPPPPLEFEAPPPPSRALAVRVDVEDRWLKPEDAASAHASADEPAAFAWFVARRNPLPGKPFGPEPMLPVRVPPGGASDLVAFPAVGRYAMDAGGARVNVSVLPSLPAGEPRRVYVVPTANGLRAAPDEVEVGEGSGIVLVSRAPMGVTLREREWMRLVSEGENASFPGAVFPELGDWDLVLVARAVDDAHGVATARLIVDSRKPDEAMALGPFRGGFTLPQDAPEEHVFSARHAMREVQLNFTTQPKLSIPVAVEVTLVDDDGREVARATGANGTLLARDLPPGDYRLVARLTEGALSAYTVEGVARLLLEPPDSFFNS